MIVVEVLLLALLLVALPLASARQLRGLDPEAIPRAGAYLESMATIALFGVAGVWLGARRFGMEGIGLEVPAEWGAVVGRGFLLLGVAMAIVFAFEADLKRRGGRRSPWVTALIPRTGLERVLFALLSVAAGFGEEIAFRGWAMSAVAQWSGSPALALVWTSLAFGWIHGYQGLRGRVRASLLGGVLGLPLLFGWGLWPSIVAHTWVDWLGGFVLGPRILRAEDGSEAGTSLNGYGRGSE